jgi:hypothetical protein
MGALCRTGEGGAMKIKVITIILEPEPSDPTQDHATLITFANGMWTANGPLYPRLIMKLTAAQKKELTRLRINLSERRALLDMGYTVLVNETVEYFGKINGLISAYNVVLGELRTFIEATAEEFRDTIDEKSDRWRESEAGEASTAFVEQWETTAGELTDLEPIEFVEPDAPEIHAIEIELDGLPEEAE